MSEKIRGVLFLQVPNYNLRGYKNLEKGIKIHIKVLHNTKITSSFGAQIWHLVVDQVNNILIFEFRVGLLPSKKTLFYLLQWQPFKNDEKCFLFHLKSSSHSQDIYMFVLTFWACRKHGLIRKMRLISKFMTS